tara:strand:+ start:291 stop:497 length:207 start_codon:yes stop_codon:yes gene_type:complete
MENVERQEDTELMTVKEAAHFLRVTEVQIRRFAQSGQLAHYKTSKGSKAHYRFTKEHLVDYMVSTVQN